MNNRIIYHLLQNNILSLSLAANDNTIKTYLNAIKLNNSLIVLYLKEFNKKYIQNLFDVFLYNNSLQQLYITDNNYNQLTTILSYFKTNYFINIHLVLYAYFDISNIEDISKLLITNNNSIIELFCIISNDINISLDLMLNDQINNSDHKKVKYEDNSNILIIQLIKPLINALINNKLLYLHLNFTILYYDNKIQSVLTDLIKEKYNLTNDIMNRLEITNNCNFYDPIPMKLK